MTAIAPPEPAPSPERRVATGVAIGLVVVGMLLVPVVRWGWNRVTRDPSRDGRERILFVGDSMMIGASRQLSSRFGKAGVETRFIGYPGTGLLSGQGWWNREIGHAVETWHPDAVVIEACCNYRSGEPGYQLSDGTTIAAGSAAMYDQWRHQAKDAVRRAKAHGADVFWVVTPAVSDVLWPAYKERIGRFNQISADTGATPVDWRKVLTPDGSFHLTLPVDGRNVKVRKDDGLHITEDGNALVVDETWKTVAPAVGVQ